MTGLQLSKILWFKTVSDRQLAIQRVLDVILVQVGWLTSSMGTNGSVLWMLSNWRCFHHREPAGKLDCDNGKFCRVSACRNQLRVCKAVG